MVSHPGRSLALILGALAGLAGLLFTRAGERHPAKPRARAIVAAFYPEGPCYLAGKLYYAEYSAHRIICWDGRRAEPFWYEEKYGPSAVLPLPDGTLLVACYDRNCLVRLDTEGRRVETIEQDVNGKSFKGPNDFALAPGGGVYFSASGEWGKEAKEKKVVEGKLYYRTPGGEVHPVDQDLHYPNGLAVVEGGKSLLVAEHLQNRILKYTIGKGGALTGRAVWKRLSDIQPDPTDAPWSLGPDGLKSDSRGNVYICQFGAARILVTGPDGKWLRTVTLPLKYVTNVALGPNEESLFVTAVQDGENPPYLGAVYELPNR
jgi:sugar lactone lactonase YvrE